MLDVTVLGEALIDFTELGYSENGNRLFEQNAGGAPANVASAVARLGGRAAFIGKAGADMHGVFLRDTLRGVGVDTTGFLLDPSVFTTLAFVALAPTGERAFSFARKPGADTCLRPEDVPAERLQHTRIFHVGSLSLTDEPARAATLYALEQAKAAGVILAYDPNYRASLWSSEEEAAKQMRSVLGYMDVMKLSDEETVLLTGRSAPEDAAAYLAGLGIRAVAVTLGSKGAYVYAGGEGRLVEGFRAHAVDTTGAGDAFWGGFLYGIAGSGRGLSELKLEDYAAFARLGNATASLCIRKRGGIPAMPVMAEVQELLNKWKS